MTLANADKDKLELAGRKAVTLHEIIGLGINVPAGFVVTTSAFSQFLKKSNLNSKIQDLLSTVNFERVDSLMQVSTHIKTLVIRSALSEELISQISNEYKKLGGIFKDADVTIGKNKTNAKGIESVITNIKRIWASQFDPKHLLQNYNTGKTGISDGTPIIIQKSINSGKSGKIFISDLRIETHSKLNHDQVNELKTIGKKLQKHFYIPQVVSFAVEKNSIYVIDIEPATNVQQSHLVLVRHGQSKWNAKDLWTGWTDVSLSGKGHEDARKAGKKLKDIHFDVGYTSALLRAQQTLEEIMAIKDQGSLPVVKNKALNERNYGDLTGKNKWEVKKEFGEEQFLKWRRGWDAPIPNGESLKDVYQRAVPFYENVILPQLKSGKNVIIAAHGNSLRALAKYLENISDDDISKLEIGVGEILVYRVNEEGDVVDKEIRN